MLNTAIVSLAFEDFYEAERYTMYMVVHPYAYQ